MTNLSLCQCGQKAEISPNNSLNVFGFYFVSCSDKNCKYKIVTFSTKEISCCTELWNATIKYRVKNNIIKSYV